MIFLEKLEKIRSNSELDKNVELHDLVGRGLRVSLRLAGRRGALLDRELA